MNQADLHRPTNVKSVANTVKSEVVDPSRSMFDDFSKQEASNYIDIRKARELAGDKPAPDRRDNNTEIAFGGAAQPLRRHISHQSEDVSPTTLKEKKTGNKVSMEDLDVSSQSKYMPNKLPFMKEEDQEPTGAGSVIKLKKTSLAKSPSIAEAGKRDDTPLNLGPPQIEDTDDLQSTLLNPQTKKLPFLVQLPGTLPI